MPTLYDTPMSEVRVLPPGARKGNGPPSSLLTIAGQSGAPGSGVNHIGVPTRLGDDGQRTVSTSSFASTSSNYSNAFNLQSPSAVVALSPPTQDGTIPKDRALVRRSIHRASSSTSSTEGGGAGANGNGGNNHNGSARGSSRLAQISQSLSPVPESPKTPTQALSSSGGVGGGSARGGGGSGGGGVNVGVHEPANAVESPPRPFHYPSRALLLPIAEDHSSHGTTLPLPSSVEPVQRGQSQGQPITFNPDQIDRHTPVRPPPPSQQDQVVFPLESLHPPPHLSIDTILPYHAVTAVDAAAAAAASSAPSPSAVSIKELIALRSNAAFPYQYNNPIPPQHVTAPIDLDTTAATARETYGNHPNPNPNPHHYPYPSVMSEFGQQTGARESADSPFQPLQQHPSQQQQMAGSSFPFSNPQFKPLVLGSGGGGGVVYPIDPRRRSHRGGVGAEGQHGSEVASYGMGSTDSGRGLLHQQQHHTHRRGSDGDERGYPLPNSFSYEGGQAMEPSLSASTLQSQTGPSPNRFTIEDYDNHDDSATLFNDEKYEGKKKNRAVTPATVSGWDKEGGGKRLLSKKACAWCVGLLLVIIGIVVGVSVTVTNQERSQHRNAVAAASARSSSAALASMSALTSSSTIAVASTLAAGASGPFSMGSIGPYSTLTVSPSTVTMGVTTSPTLSTRPLTTTATSTSTAIPTNEVQRKIYSTSFAYQISGTSTTVPITYTIPPAASIQTRSNGQWQFTQLVTLPSLGAGAGSAEGGTGTFMSQLRFRVKPVSTEAVSTPSSSSSSSSAAATATSSKGAGGKALVNVANQVDVAAVAVAIAGVGSKYHHRSSAASSTSVVSKSGTKTTTTTTATSTTTVTTVTTTTVTKTAATHPHAHARARDLDLDRTKVNTSGGQHNRVMRRPRYFHS